METSKDVTNPARVLQCDERIAIIGAGVAGIATAAAFHRAGYSNIVVYDKHETMGGLWVDNYPNASGTCTLFHVQLNGIGVNLT
jgi:cation diffusion facilitator CzcD-associated flavoprotein CzcO